MGKGLLPHFPPWTNPQREKYNQSRHQVPLYTSCLILVAKLSFVYPNQEKYISSQPQKQLSSQIPNQQNPPGFPSGQTQPPYHTHLFPFPKKSPKLQPETITSSSFPIPEKCFP